MPARAAESRAFAAAREIAALVPIPVLLEALGFEVNERTHRCACILHRGSNRSAFSWREDGRWHCFSCGRGGDRIAHVRAVRQCGFPEAVAFLAGLAGVEYAPGRVPRAEIERERQLRLRAGRAAWDVYDRLAHLRRHYAGALHRSDRVCAAIGKRLRRERNPRLWDSLARLAPAQSFSLAAFQFLSNGNPANLARFASASPAQRRKFFFEVSSDAATSAAA